MHAPGPTVFAEPVYTAAEGELEVAFPPLLEYSPPVAGLALVVPSGAVLEYTAPALEATTLDADEASLTTGAEEAGTLLAEPGVEYGVDSGGTELE